MSFVGLGGYGGMPSFLQEIGVNFGKSLLPDLVFSQYSKSFPDSPLATSFYDQISASILLRERILSIVIGTLVSNALERVFTPIHSWAKNQNNRVLGINVLEATAYMTHIFFLNFIPLLTGFLFYSYTGVAYFSLSSLAGFSLNNVCWHSLSRFMHFQFFCSNKQAILESFAYWSSEHTIILKEELNTRAVLFSPSKEVQQIQNNLRNREPTTYLQLFYLIQMAKKEEKDFIEKLQSEEVAAYQTTLYYFLDITNEARAELHTYALSLQKRLLAKAQPEDEQTLSKIGKINLLLSKNSEANHEELENFLHTLYRYEKELFSSLTEEEKKNYLFLFNPSFLPQQEPG